MEKLPGPPGRGLPELEGVGRAMVGVCPMPLPLMNDLKAEAM